MFSHGDVHTALRANTLQFLNHDITYTLFTQNTPTICTYKQFYNNVKESSTAADHTEIKLWLNLVVERRCNEERYKQKLLTRHVDLFLEDTMINSLDPKFHVFARISNLMLDLLKIACTV